MASAGRHAGGEAEAELHWTGGPRREGRLPGGLDETERGEVLQAGVQGSVMAGRHYTLYYTHWEVLMNQREFLMTREVKIKFI